MNGARGIKTQTISPMIFVLSVRRAPQRLDLVVQAVAVVGDDAFDHREPVLDRPQFGAKLGVFLADQLDALHRLVAGPGIDCLAPGAVRTEEHKSELQSLMRNADTV